MSEKTVEQLVDTFGANAAAHGMATLQCVMEDSCVDDLRESREALLSRISELQKDAGRLNWVGRHYAQFKSAIYTTHPPHRETTISWVKFSSEEFAAPDERETTGEDFRGAIDTAMREDAAARSPDREEAQK